MIIVGICSLSFIGLALEDADVPQIKSSYSGGLILWTLQGMAAIATQLAIGRYAFTVNAGLATLSTFLVFYYDLFMKDKNSIDLD